ncbi:MAG: YbaB/EbfC family nucleoid-associated protein [Vulcanimicrobiota bacterium]
MQSNILRSMQKMFQENLEKIQEDLVRQVVEGNSGGGAVIIQMNGKQEIVSVKIDRSVVNADAVEELEDLVLAAFKDAIARSQGIAAEKMNTLTGGLNIPGLF